MASTRVKITDLPDDVTTLTYVGTPLEVKDGIVTIPDDAPEGFLEAFLRDNPDHEVQGSKAKAAAADAAAQASTGA